jgi:glycosyltransferase involved in cell wall biosynthesis
MKTTNKIEVSVIIPNYNYGHYIKQCINSVLESEFDHNLLEIIIVDDASPDNSIDIIEHFRNNSKTKIHLLKQNSNMGLAKARNAGIKKASGKYLFLLDSDNYIGKNCIKIHYDFLSANTEYAACYAPIQKFDDQTARMLNMFSNQQYDYDKLLYGNYIDAMAMIKKEAVLELGLYDEDMPYSGWEDYELWLRMGSNGKKVYFIDGKPLSFYRVHENSMIRSLQTDTIGALAAYISEKYALDTVLKKDESSHTKIQIFWAGAEAVFTEGYSLVQFARLSDAAKTLKFELGAFIEDIEFIRFDLGDEVGLISIHSITVEDDLQNIKWSWDKCTLHGHQNLVLIENKKLWQDTLLQISSSIDPAFIIKTNNAVKALSSSGLVIEITLSCPDPRQLNFLNTHTRPLTCFSENEFTLLEQCVSNLNVEKNALLTHVEIQSRHTGDLEKENSMLSESNIIIQQFNKQLNEDKINSNEDKLLLTSELNLKNELLIKAENKIEILENKLYEKTEKEVTLIEAHRNAVQEHNEIILSQKDELQKIQEGYTAQIISLSGELEKTRIAEAEQRSLALHNQEKFQSTEALTFSLQREIKIEQEKITGLNNQLALNEGKLNELQFVCALTEDRNNEVTGINNRLEQEINNLLNSLSENLKQKQELIASIDLHLAYAERLGNEKNELAEKHVSLQDQLSLIKLDKQQIEMLLIGANNSNIENENTIHQLKEDILRFKNQNVITFIKGKMNRKPK